MLLDRELHLEIYYGRMLTSRMTIIVHKEIYSRPYTVFKQMYQLWLNQ
jgi:hypothetical protein